MSMHVKKVESRAADKPLRVCWAEPAAAAAEPRIYGLFPAQVRGVDSSGETFHVQTLLDNFSAAEFYLRLARRVEVGGQLLVVADIHEATVALHGRVISVEPDAGGVYRLTVAVTHHRFL